MTRSALLALATAGGLAGTASAQPFGRPVEPNYVGNWFYVDHNRAGGAVRDWNCAGSTYDQHNGTDFSMANGHSQSEGIPIHAAGGGTVDRAVDGYFDQCGGCTSSGNCSANAANYVTVNHGSLEYYFHLRNGSLNVVVGSVVGCGTQVGQMGSSGCSNGTHLHFEPRLGDRVTYLDPFGGSCSGGSMWISQGPWRGMPGGCDPAAGLHGTLMGVDAPATLFSGDRATVEIDVRNEGPNTWDGSIGLAGGSELADPTWIDVDHPAMLQGSIGPGQIARFTFLIQAPPVATTTTFTETLMMVHGGTAFDPKSITLSVDVNPTDDSVADDDGDGFVRMEDCNDHDAAFHPGAPDVCGDGLDQNCDGHDGVGTSCNAEKGGGGCAAGGTPGGGALALIALGWVLWRRWRRGAVVAVAMLGACGGGSHEAPDAAPGTCVATGPEQCDGIDNDCNGAIDEGCEYYFGRASSLTTQQLAGNGIALSPRLSNDGLTLTYIMTIPNVGERPVQSTRPSPADPFGAPVQIPVDVPQGLSLSAATLSADGLEMIAQMNDGDWNLYRATRATTDAPLSGFTRLDVSSPAYDIHPFLTRDGLELLWSSLSTGPRRIFRATRTSPDAPFGPSEMLQLNVDAGTDADGPTLSDDGSTLFFTESAGGVARFARAKRLAPGGLDFDAPVVIVELGSAGFNEFLVVSEATHEAFFSSSRSWAAGTWGLFRTRVCRAGECLEPEIECSSHVRSADRQHCYQAFGEQLSWTAAEAKCEQLAPPGGHGHLMTIDTQAEQDIAAGLAQGIAGNPWIGASDQAAEGTWVWVTGEPWLFGHWNGGEPNNANGGENYAQLTATGWNDIPEAGPLPYLCETEVYPAW